MFSRQVLHIWRLSVLRISMQSLSPCWSKVRWGFRPHKTFWASMQPVRVSGSSEIPDWFEKTLFTPSTHDRARATSWIFLMERRESAAVGSLHLFFRSVFWFLNSCKSTTPHEETSDRWSVVFSISTSLVFHPPEHLRRVFGNIRMLEMPFIHLNRHKSANHWTEKINKCEISSLGVCWCCCWGLGLPPALAARLELQRRSPFNDREVSLVRSLWWKITGSLWATPLSLWMRVYIGSQASMWGSLRNGDAAKLQKELDLLFNTIWYLQEQIIFYYRRG